MTQIYSNITVPSRNLSKIKTSMFQKKFFIERNSETAEMKNLIAIR